jgi:hypothetical protein
MCEIPQQNPLNYQYTLYKMKDKKVKQSCPEVGINGGNKERTKEGKHGE